MGSARFLVGDVVHRLPQLDAASFDAVLCDPPYGLSFMGKEWDRGVPGAPVWAEVLRLLRPGAPLIAAGGTRTYHRLTCAIEDAGFEIRDCLMWLYGTGFPKSLDIAKATKSQTWSGYGTALAPSWEPFVLAMKPTDGTFAANAVKHGVAGINVEASRIGTSKSVPSSPSGANAKWVYGDRSKGTGRTSGHDPNVGRWPKNAILDETAGAMLDAQSGESKSSARPRNNGAFKSVANGADKARVSFGHDDSGGASRFFYCPKVSTKERNAGLCEGEENGHPTLKPIELCRYIATLLLPPFTGRPRRLLVPFSGSGSEACGALLAGWDEVVGVELDPSYARIAAYRAAHWNKKAPSRTSGSGEAA